MSAAERSGEPWRVESARVVEGPFGVIATLPLPEGKEPVPEGVLARLHPEERRLALAFAGRRQIEWTGGRLALRSAADHLGLTLGPVGRGERGEPLLPEGLTASVSHKRRLAAAALALDGAGTIGLDVEELGPPRMLIADRVLLPEEAEAIDALPDAERWPALLRRFAAKEAVYKALHPHVRRYVSFHEAELREQGAGELSVSLRLARGEGPFEVEARCWGEGDWIWAMARVRRP